MPISTLAEKIQYELSDIYDAEHQFLQAHQALRDLTTSPPLRGVLQEHREQTEQQIANLEHVRFLMGWPNERVTCEAVQGLFSEGQRWLKEAAQTPEIRDCVVAGVLCKIEHYAISSYRGLVMGTQLLGNADAVALLRENLRADEKTVQVIECNMPQLLEVALQATAQA